MFDELVENLNRYRLGILNNLLKNQLPDLKEEKENFIKLEEDEKGKNKIIRFLHAVPRFVGPELELYGPFEADEIATLPEEIVRVLIEKNRAEEIKDGS